MDISTYMQASAPVATVEGPADMRATFDANPVPMWVFDIESLTILAVNDAAVSHYRYSREQFLAMSITDLRPAEDADLVRSLVATEHEGLRRAGVHRHLRADGSPAFASVTSHDVAWDGRPSRLVAAVDVGDSVEGQRALREMEARFQSIVEACDQGIVVIDTDASITYANGRMGELLGCAADDLVGRPASRLVGSNASVMRRAITRLLSAARPRTFEARLHRADGTDIWALISSSPLATDGGAPGGLVATVTDISRRRSLEERIQRHALHDEVTGLPNRLLLVDRIAQGRLRNQVAALLVIDIDSFARVNQILGHSGCDELLTRVGERLRHNAPGGTVARVGDDRFAVLLPDVGDPSDALAWARLCRDVVAEPVTVAGSPIHILPAVGLVIDMATARVDEFVRFAEAAVDHAKRTHSAEPVVFRDELFASVRHRFLLEAELRQALSRDELLVQYQPIIRLADGLPSGAEALVRWQHPTRGLLHPGAFLPHAEESDLICRIGEYVLREACRQAATWHRETPESFYTVSVNVAARQLANSDFVDTVAAVLTETGVAPALIRLEITEASLIADVGIASDTLHRLKALGVSLALDDFGTGYSSLAYLKRFPFDVVKIDKTFIDGLGRQAEDTAIVRAVIDLASALGMSVVAEGVETASQRAELTALSCEYGQGFLWRPAVDADEVSRLRRIWASPGLVTVAGGAKVETRRGDDGHAVVAAVAHELRQPLSVISGYSELLLEGSHDSCRTEHYAHAMARSAHAMRRIVETIADAQDADRGLLSLVVGQTTLQALLSTIWDRATRYVSAGRAVHVDDNTADAPVVVDVDRVAQVLDNLIVNADRYSPQGTPIEVRATVSETEVEIIVRDHGPGIAEHDVAYVFRKFARLNNAKRGSGLGLYIGRAIARAHGGDLRYRHSTTGGADFVLSLPVRDHA